MLKSYRINRLFHPRSHRCFNVAIDHGFFNQPGFLQGIEDIRSVVKALVEAGPDAIQLTVGQAKHLQSIPGRQKPSLVLRADIANIYGHDLPTSRYSAMLANAAIQAVQLDATCICVNLFLIPGAPDVNHQCISNILQLKRECDSLALPLMIEPLVFRPNSEKGGYMVDGDEIKIMHLVRQAVELGADIIKADPTDDVKVFHRIVKIAGDVPVLVRGGGKVSDSEILERTWHLLQQGASGIVYGRNVIQHKSPSGITKSLMAILHEDATLEQAKQILLDYSSRERYVI